MNAEEGNEISKEMANKRIELENHLKKIDKLIYDSESKYLENTQGCGNIIRGWEQIFATKSKLGSTANAKKTKFTNNERIFSQTSFSNSCLREEGSSLPGLRIHSQISNKSSFNSLRNRKKITLKKKKIINGIGEKNLKN